MLYQLSYFRKKTHRQEFTIPETRKSSNPTGTCFFCGK